MMEIQESSSDGGSSDVTLLTERPASFSRGGEEPSSVSMKSNRSSGDPSGFSPERVTCISGFIKRHKSMIKKKYENLFEGIRTEENRILLNSVYTQLYITEGESEGVNEEHEVLQMEKTSRKHLQDSPINCSEIFKPLQGSKGEPEEEKTGAEKTEDLKMKEREDKGVKEQKIRSVLTKGIAGIGKTVSVQKFILDWAEGKANQEVDLMFVLPFRELNLIKDDQYSLHDLLCVFHPEIKDLNPKIYHQIKAVFIFDGLDESRIPLNFKQCKKVSDVTMTSSDCENVSAVTMTSSVGVLMTNLIKGDLLPSAHIWITSRPAAANLIPLQLIERVTEIQGFSNSQKEEYFRKRIRDQDQVQKIISHIKTVRSLHIMCRIPVFCWISATVLQEIMKEQKTEIPKTLTEMYSHFLITQINMKNEKYEEKEVRDPKKLLESNRTVFLKLAKLAFKQLMKGNVMFYEEDLKESRINVTKASVYSGIFTQIFREECILYQRKVYCFVHLSFQEFLAAVFVFHCFQSKIMKELKEFLPKYRYWSENDPLDDLLKGAVNKAVESQNGHLDLFLHFLLGISVESNQKLLQGLLTHTQSNSEEITHFIKNLIKHYNIHISTERSINLFLCLSEMKDESLSRELQEFLKSQKHSEVKLSPGQCSVLVCMLLTSEEGLDELDLKKYRTSEDGYKRLIPAVRVCRKALLSGCNLTQSSCETLCSVLQSVNSLKEVDLSNNDLQNSGVKLLSAGLKSSHCKLEILRLSGCMITEKGCSSLASALKSNPSHLRELDLSYNHPEELGVKLLSDLLKDPHCSLEKLRVEFGGEIRMKPGYKKYACDVTLDPNTACSDLSVSERNRKVCVGKKQSYPDHPDRFTQVHQVLSVESLTGRCYWEAKWSGMGAQIAVSYRGIRRKGISAECKFGNNNLSWSLNCAKDSYCVRHNTKYTDIPVPSRSRSRRVGVYLDWSAGTLSFYSVSPDTHTLTHLHTFTTTFTEPLYAGFRVYTGSVCLCEIK